MTARYVLADVATKAAYFSLVAVTFITPKAVQPRTLLHFAGVLSMVQFTLPKNSKITEGKIWERPARTTNVRECRVYRWNPDDGKNPRMDAFFVDCDDCGPMVLDALIWIKYTND